MKIAIFVLSMLTFQTLVGAQEMKVPDLIPLKKATDNFMSKLSNGQEEAAFNELINKYWFNRNDAASVSMSLKGQYLGMKPKIRTIGKRLPNGYEFLGYRRVGKSAVRLVYGLKYEHQFLPWAFSFYKAENQWTLNAVAFGDTVSDDLRALSINEPAK